MPTAFPSIDQDNAFLLELRDRFERDRLPDGGFEAQERDIHRIYITHARRPYVCAFMADVLEGRYGLGCTQEEVAYRLGMDRTRISDALRKGDLSLDSYLMLRYHPDRMYDWVPHVSVIDMMNRSGFIAVAKHLAQYSLPAQSGSLIALDEFHYECVCVMFDDYFEWMRGRLAESVQAAERLIRIVRKDRKDDVIPFWYGRDEKAQVKRLMRNLQDDPADAFAYLCRVQDQWQSIFVATDAVTEMLRLEAPE